jgi:uncharacterized protein (TIGR02444 family)
MPDIHDLPIWPFARALYARPGVADACLALQSRHGADVDLLIYAAWIGASGRGLVELSDLAQLRAAAAPWQADIVLALRSIRRRLKLPLDAIAAEEGRQLSRRVLDVEIEAERLLLEAWAANAAAASEASIPVRRGDAAANLEAGLSLFSVGQAGDEDRRHLATIASASVA